jgi:hypothetical protein
MKNKYGFVIIKKNITSADKNMEFPLLLGTCFYIEALGETHTLLDMKSKKNIFNLKNIKIK